MINFNKNKGHGVAYCDMCSVDHEDWADTWAEFVSLIKQGGWGVWKEDEEWRHYCPDCNKDRKRMYAQEMRTK